MTTVTNTKEYTIDASGKKLGRVASEAAMILRGKNSPDFTPNKVSGNKVHVINASKIDLADVKLLDEYMSYSGYAGGQKRETRGHLIDRKGYAPVFEKAVYGMLASNKLRAPLMKNLTITE
ncbi:MAG: 50S ribosomal protein L13 [Candidatus Nomurabacteria bacterium]|nr:50S ribosomal protein L13 [Candidatus Nomurabacteria bacterium]